MSRGARTGRGRAPDPQRAVEMVEAAWAAGAGPDHKTIAAASGLTAAEVSDLVAQLAATRMREGRAILGHPKTPAPAPVPEPAAPVEAAETSTGPAAAEDPPVGGVDPAAHVPPAGPVDPPVDWRAARGHPDELIAAAYERAAAEVTTVEEMLADDARLARATILRLEADLEAARHRLTLATAGGWHG